ncbi:MAG: hypothetical protein M3296_04970 [Actinomycetota bacterium]|nr:hypothetical protein [Actinomycetota bacterium]
MTVSRGPGDLASVAGLVLAVVVVVMLLFTFRGLVYVTLPVSALAVALGAWGTVSASRAGYRLLAILVFVLGLLALLVSLAALAVELDVSSGYNLYERQR